MLITEQKLKNICRTEAKIVADKACIPITRNKIILNQIPVKYVTYCSLSSNTDHINYTNSILIYN